MNGYYHKSSCDKDDEGILNLLHLEFVNFVKIESDKSQSSKLFEKVSYT